MSPLDQDSRTLHRASVGLLVLTLLASTAVIARAFCRSHVWTGELSVVLVSIFLCGAVLLEGALGAWRAP